MSISNIAEGLRPNVVPIASITHHPENPRMGDVDAIAESLGRFGQVRPIVVQESTGYIVAGNHTTKAARSLGWTEIAAVRVALSDEDALAYLLADNRLADRGSYDNEVLRELLQRASGNLAGTGYDEDDVLGMMDDMPSAIPTEHVSVDDIQAHERNPRKHTPEQLTHLTQSLKEHGIFREIVVASDGTILAGHGIVEALREMGVRKLPVKRLPYGPNDPEALKVIAADNEIGRLVERDDRALTELLKDVRESGDVTTLLGTGLDAEQLAGLVLTTRPESEVADFNAAAEWVGMPDFQPQADRIQLVLAFDTEAQRDELIEQLGLIIAKKTRKTWSAWWPPRELEDLSSLRFERGDGTAAASEPVAGDSPEGTAADLSDADAERLADEAEADPTPEELARVRAAVAELPTTGASDDVQGVQPQPPDPALIGTSPLSPPVAEQDAANATLLPLAPAYPQPVSRPGQLPDEGIRERQALTVDGVAKAFDLTDDEARELMATAPHDPEPDRSRTAPKEAAIVADHVDQFGGPSPESVAEQAADIQRTLLPDPTPPVTEPEPPAPEVQVPVVDPEQTTLDVGNRPSTVPTGLDEFI